MHTEELRARVEQLESELIVLKHVLRLILSAHRRRIAAFPSPRLDLETVRRVRQEIQAEWAQEWREGIPPDLRSM